MIEPAVALADDHTLISLQTVAQLVGLFIGGGVAFQVFVRQNQSQQQEQTQDSDQDVNVDVTVEGPFRAENTELEDD